MVILRVGRLDGGWGEPYTGGGVYDPTDATGGHFAASSRSRRATVAGRVS